MITHAEHIRNLTIIYYVMSPLSMLTSLFIMVTFLRFPGQLFTCRVNHLQFVFFQSFCDFMFSAKFLFTAVLMKPEWIRYGPVPFTPIITPNATHPEYEDIVCMILGASGQFFVMGSVTWNLMVSIQILGIFWFQPYDFSLTVSSRPLNNAVPYHLFVWSVAIGTAVAPVFLNQYGPTTNGCWVQEPFFLTRLLIFVFPLTLFTFISLVILIVAVSKMRLFSLRAMYIQKFNPTIESTRFPTLRLLISYTAVFITFWLCPVILRMLELVHKQPVILVYGDIISMSSQGLANALVWGTSPYVRDLFKKRSAYSSIKTVDEEWKE